ncbi:MAG: ThiF family adenylyltransferase [Nitrospira sp.]|nr:MAG: ThiF family adenylyltransferase [Nitrospira sp.]
MPDWPLAAWHRKAVAALAAYIQNHTPPGRELSSSELGRSSSPSRGWRISTEVNGQSFELDIIVDLHFPFSLPSIFLVGQDRFLSWPHVEQSGKLCLLPEHAGFEISTDVRLIDHLVQNARDLIRQCLDGSNRADLATEVISYWGAGLNDAKVKRFWSILKPVGPTRSIAYWEGQRFVLLAETAEKGRTWLEHFKGEFTGSRFSFSSGIFLWLPAPLYPEQYPANNTFLREIAKKLGQHSVDVLVKVIKSSQEGFPVVFGFDVGQDSVLAGAWSLPLNHSIPHHNARSSLTRGFRSGKIPPAVIARRYLASPGVLEKRRVQRCDRAWIHARGGDAKAARHVHKRIMLIGCGALGSQIAELLAQGGVGRLVLVDHDTLSWDNVGRHILGGPGQVGTNKAEAIGKELQQRFPELDIVAAGRRWQDVYQQKEQLFRECDVIVSTTGDWASEAALNLLARRSPHFPPVVFGWSEAYACAGHAVAVLDMGGCLTCGMDGLGTFQHSPISWSVTPIPQREPGCGGFFQPFGSIATNPINAMIASTALDVLEGTIARSHHRLWVGSSEALTSHGAQWSEAWIARYGEIGTGERVYRLAWPVQEHCPLCQK